jgi:nucleoside-triphosphatase THEP1
VYLRISEHNDFLIISIKEKQIHRLTAPVNILCADPGMGKTTLLKKLKNECDSRFWTIDVDLKTHNEFFKKKHDANELLNHLFEGNENTFSKHIRDAFRSKKKVYFFFTASTKFKQLRRQRFGFRQRIVVWGISHLDFLSKKFKNEIRRSFQQSCDGHKGN